MRILLGWVRVIVVEWLDPTSVRNYAWSILGLATA